MYFDDNDFLQYYKQMYPTLSSRMLAQSGSAFWIVLSLIAISSASRAVSKTAAASALKSKLRRSVLSIAGIAGSDPELQSFNNIIVNIAKNMVSKGGLLGVRGRDVLALANFLKKTVLSGKISSLKVKAFKDILTKKLGVKFDVELDTLESKIELMNLKNMTQPASSMKKAAAVVL